MGEALCLRAPSSHQTPATTAPPSSGLRDFGALRAPGTARRRRAQEARVARVEREDLAEDAAGSARHGVAADLAFPIAHGVFEGEFGIGSVV